MEERRVRISRGVPFFHQRWLIPCHWRARPLSDLQATVLDRSDRRYDTTGECAAQLKVTDGHACGFCRDSAVNLRHRVESVAHERLREGREDGATAPILTLRYHRWSADPSA